MYSNILCESNLLTTRIVFITVVNDTSSHLLLLLMSVDLNSMTKHSVQGHVIFTTECQVIRCNNAVQSNVGLPRPTMPNRIWYHAPHAVHCQIRYKLIVGATIFPSCKCEKTGIRASQWSYIWNIVFEEDIGAGMEASRCIISIFPSSRLQLMLRTKGMIPSHSTCSNVFTL